MEKQKYIEQAICLNNTLKKLPFATGIISTSKLTVYFPTSKGTSAVQELWHSCL